jgi:hypothetical protein
VVISFLVIAIIYSSFSEFAQGRPIWGTHHCNSNFLEEKCCWMDVPDVGPVSLICQTCYDKDGYDGYEDCDPYVVTRTEAGDVRAPIEGGVIEDSLTPTSPFAPPTGVLEQPLTATTPPPLFGRNDPNVPLQGGGVFGQPTPTPPPTSPFAPPTGGVFDPPKPAPTIILTPFPFPSPSPVSPIPTPTSPFSPPTGGVFDQPTVSPPTPVTTPPPPQTLPPTPPQDDGSGPLNPQGGGILQQPEEVEDPEGEGENEEEEGSSDGDQGQETAGPLT